MRHRVRFRLPANDGKQARLRRRQGHRRSVEIGRPTQPNPEAGQTSMTGNAPLSERGRCGRSRRLRRKARKTTRRTPPATDGASRPRCPQKGHPRRAAGRDCPLRKPATGVWGAFGVCTCRMQFSPGPGAYTRIPVGSRAQAWFWRRLYALVCVVCICLKREKPKIGPTAKTTAYTAYKTRKCPLSPTPVWFLGFGRKLHTKCIHGAYEMHTTGKGNIKRTLNAQKANIAFDALFLPLPAMNRM